MADTPRSVIPVLLGSHRPSPIANGPGLFLWLSSLVSSVSASIDLELADSLLASTGGVPSASFTDAVIPAVRPRSPSALARSYPSAQLAAFSRLVADAPALVILTPQYNHGYPGGLKNALDSLYHEWRAKPVLVVTYGGHGGRKAGAQLDVVCRDGLKMRVVGTVGVTLPDEYIRGEERVREGEGGRWPAFLEAYEAEVREALAELVQGEPETTPNPLP
ncbi:SPOSA6832_02086, partial [Sporobolomyces salmonicolor]